MVTALELIRGTRSLLETADTTLPLRPNMPTPEGAELGRELARLADVEEANLVAAGKPVPKRCGDCALRLGTVPNQCAQTLIDIVICSATLAPFMCHVSRDVEGDPRALCRGFELLMTSTVDSQVAQAIEAATEKL